MASPLAQLASVLLLLLVFVPHAAAFVNPRHHFLSAARPADALSGPATKLCVPEELVPRRRDFRSSSITTPRTIPVTSSTQLEAIPRALASVTSPLLSLSVMGLIVLVHELGHYLPAKLFGMEVLEFSIGMGPKLLGFHALGNAFSLRAIPIGGYVLFAGEDALEKEDMQGTDPSNWLTNRHWWQRAVVYSGGVVFNFILAYVLFFGCFANFANKLVSDISTNLDNQAISAKATVNWPRLAQFTLLHTKQVIQEIATAIGGLFLDKATSAAVSFGNFWMAPFRKLFSLFWSKAPSLVEPIAAQASSMAEPLVGEFVGPIGLAQVGSKVASQGGIEPLLLLAATVSVNLGVVNALPLPIFDGGNLLFLLFEAITGRKVNRRVEIYARFATFLFLLYFTVTASIGDVSRLFAS